MEKFTAKSFKVVTMQELDLFRQEILAQTLLSMDEDSGSETQIEILIQKANQLFLDNYELDSFTIAGQVLLSSSVILKGLETGEFMFNDNFFYLDKSQPGQTFLKLNHSDKINWHIDRLEWSMRPMKGFKEHLQRIKDAIFTKQKISAGQREAKILKRYLISWLMLDDNCLDTVPRMFNSVTVKKEEENSTLLLA